MVATAHLTICVGQQDTAWRWRSYVEKRASVRETIYEEDFLGFSYGFRPGRSAHDAMDALVVAIERRPPHKKTVSLSNFVQSAVSCLAQIVF
jgi:hypothetical protein